MSIFLLLLLFFIRVLNYSGIIAAANLSVGRHREILDFVTRQPSASDVHGGRVGGEGGDIWRRVANMGVVGGGVNHVIRGLLAFEQLRRRAYVFLFVGTASPFNERAILAE